MSPLAPAGPRTRAADVRAFMADTAVDVLELP
jgi:hypothetical protein